MFDYLTQGHATKVECKAILTVDTLYVAKLKSQIPEQFADPDSKAEFVRFKINLGFAIIVSHKTNGLGSVSEHPFNFRISFLQNEHSFTLYLA
jgi:hypothetical protein